MVTQIQTGHTYKLWNALNSACLDLSMADFKSVTAAPWDNSDNQKWVAERAKTAPQTPGTTRWTFRSVATGLYLGVEAPQATACIIATREETEWDVRADRDDPSALRITMPNGRLGVQLGKSANPAACTPVKLWDAKDSAEQRWRLEEV